MPLSNKNKDRLFYLFLLIVIGMEGYFVYRYVLPVRRERLQQTEYLTQSRESYRQRVQRPNELPGRSVLLVHKQAQKSMLEEYANVQEFYKKHDRSLERHILNAHKEDGIGVALQYVELKKKWARQAGNPDFLKNWDWERPDGRVPTSEFQFVEKWSCVVDAVIDSLTAEGGVTLSRLAVGDPFVPDDVPNVPEVSWGVGILRYRVWPVRAQFKAPYPKLAQILERFVQRPDDLPCTKIVRMEFSVPGADEAVTPGMTQGDRVQAMLEVWVYDFETVEKRRPQPAGTPPAAAAPPATGPAPIPAQG